MKGKKVTTQNKIRSAVSLTLAVQLALSLSPLVVFAEGETLSNNTIPLAQPAPSQLVQKIWGSLDPRKFGRKKEIAAKIPEPVKPAINAESTAPSKQTTAQAESTGTAAVTGTGQIIFAAPASDKTIENNGEQANSGLKNEPAGSPEPGINSANKLIEDSVAGKGEVLAPASGSSAVDTKADTKKDETSSAPAPSVAASAPIETGTKNDQPITIASNLITLPPGSVLGKVQMQSGECAVVDNDEVEEVEETIKQEELPTDDGKTRAKAGARFPVVLSSQITSKTAKKGDPIQARLKYDLKIGDRLVAKKGSVVNGHINYVLKARTILHSLVSPERWYRNSGCIGLSFDEIINERGEHLPLSAQPSRQARIVKNKAEGRELGVNHYGQVTGPWAQQIRYKAVRIGLNAALAPAGVFSFGAMPVALGVLGAANPSFAFSRPVGLNVRHRRIKGFAWGFLSGIPGSWLIEDTTVKGQEAIVKPGDEFYAELVQEFTGEPASDAQLMPGASTKLHGQVLKDPKKDTKKKKN